MADRFPDVAHQLWDWKRWVGVGFAVGGLIGLVYVYTTVPSGCIANFRLNDFVAAYWCNGFTTEIPDGTVPLGTPTIVGALIGAGLGWVVAEIQKPKEGAS